MHGETLGRQEWSKTEIGALVAAACQILDDMGVNGLSTCEATKAQLRVAFEPFRDETEHGVMDYPLDWAESILAKL